MKVHLMFPDQDFDPDLPVPGYAADLIQDIQLRPVLTAMAADDEYLYDIAQAAVVAGCPTPAVVEYRHQVLTDCASNVATLTELYELTSALLADNRRIYRSSLFYVAESRLHLGVEVLQACLPALRRLRDIAELSATKFGSPGFRTFFTVLRNELDCAYLDSIKREVANIQARHGLVLSATLGESNNAADFVLRSPDWSNQTMFHRTPLGKPTKSFEIPARDDASFNALSTLRNDALTAAAAAVGEAVDHVIDFITQLRRESAFYLGCLNLADALGKHGHRICLPEVDDIGSPRHEARGVYDAALVLDNDTKAVASDFDVLHNPITIVTGANRGGKSTFLRAVGIAALLARCGGYVPATSYNVPLFRTVLTHFRREEDEALASGKFDDELQRMSEAINDLHAGSLLLSNESFSSTNEREGSQIAEDVLRGLADSGVAVVMVTHLYELAERLKAETNSTTFLRAQRLEDGQRTFCIVPGAPEPTSYATDLYSSIMTPPTAS